MFRSLWASVVLVGFAATLPAQERHVIKLKEAGQNETVQVEQTSTRRTELQMTDPNGKQVVDRKERETRQFVYRETVLERGDGRRPVRLQRVYEKAEVTVGGKTVTLSYQGKTIVIERKGSAYRFQADGKDVTATEVPYLDEEFNQETADAFDVRRVFLPAKPVVVAENWTIDPTPVIKDLSKNLRIDAEKAKATGRLLEVRREKDGRRYGRLNFAVEMPVKEFLRGKEIVPAHPGAKMQIELTLDGCIDGTAEAGVLQTNLLMNATTTIDGPKGFKLKMSLASEVTGEERRTEVSVKE